MTEISFSNVVIVAAVAFAAPLALGLIPKLRLPAVVLEIVLGIAVGPSGLGWAKSDLPVQVLALVGLAFLLFLAGLDVELGRLRGRLLRLAGLGFVLSLGLVFSCNGCPTVKAEEERMIAIQEAHAHLGVQLVAINSNNAYLSPANTFPEMVQRAQEKRFNFPYLKDEDGRVADAFGAMSTPPHLCVGQRARTSLQREDRRFA